MMNFASLTFLLALFGVVNAHYRLTYPGPRGAFVADTEPNFCGGYTDVTTNRTAFPLSGGFFTITTGHPGWTAGVIISTAPNPKTFDNFTVSGKQQIVSAYAHEHNAGTFCIPLNISAANIPGVKDGSNVTIQVVFDGGDGNLYQCADLTLSANLTQPPSDIVCSNATSTATSSQTQATSTSPSSSGSSKSGSLGVEHQVAAFIAVAFGFVGVVVALL